MSSENKTPNLELNQWNGNEYPKRIDFIEDNKKIDEAYKELKDSIKDGGKVSSVNGKIRDVILKAEDIKTGAGTTVENKLNELFQFADNGKKNIATVIGSPLSSSDSFDSMKSKIQGMKTMLAINLLNQGQSVNGNDTLDDLIDKVSDINLGKKFAKGLVSSNQTINLSFKPSYLILSKVYGFDKYDDESFQMYIYGFTKYTINASGNINNGSGSGGHVMGTDTYLKVSGNSFTTGYIGPDFSYLALD